MPYLFQEPLGDFFQQIKTQRAEHPCEFFPIQWQVPPIFHWHAANEWLNESKFHRAKQWKETPTPQGLKKTDMLQQWEEVTENSTQLKRQHLFL